MTPEMEAGLAERQVLLAGLVKITLPSATIRLTDGSGVVTWGSEVFAGRDAVFGTIGEVESLTEQVGDSIPGLEMTLLPPSTSAAVDLATADQQGAPVRLWLAMVDPATGIVVPDPELLFGGDVDVSMLELDRGSRSLGLSIASVWERLFEPNEGATLSDSFHRSIWPSEYGLQAMLGVEVTKLWGPGAKPPAPQIVPQIPATGPQRYF